MPTSRHNSKRHFLQLLRVFELISQPVALWLKRLKCSVCTDLIKNPRQLWQTEVAPKWLYLVAFGRLQIRHCILTNFSADSFKWKTKVLTPQIGTPCLRVHCVVKQPLLLKMNHVDFLSSFNFSCLHYIQDHFDSSTPRLAQRKEKVSCLYSKTSARNLWCTLCPELLLRDWSQARSAALIIQHSPFYQWTTNCTFFFSVRFWWWLDWHETELKYVLRSNDLQRSLSISMKNFIALWIAKNRLGGSYVKN